jgi:membrane-bound lytic murein transglycosylase D
VVASDSQTQALIDRSERFFEMGELAFDSDDYERSRKAYDSAVDVVLNSGIDLRRNEALRVYFRQLVDRIHTQQLLAQGSDIGGFADQAYVPAASEVAELSDDELARFDGSGMLVDGVYDFEFTVGQPVYQFISYFSQGRGRGTMETGLRRSGRYRAMAERIFREEGVPTDLIWLAQVESVWKPAALSRAAAKGIWQFIPSTGRRYGLDQNAWVDERSDPEQSTRAAARYLKFLYGYFAGDWLLAMAAYNSGEGNVARAIARSGYADFWEIHRAGFLPTETRNYVPAILAVMIIAHNQERYGFRVKPEPSMTFDVARIPSQTDLEVAAELAGTSADYLRDLNPELRRSTTPPWPYSLRIPRGKRSEFETAYAALPVEQRLKRPTPLEQSEESDDDTVATKRRVDGTRSTSGFGGASKTVAYSVRRGESLNVLASRHGVTVGELARLNKLSASAKLKSGQTIQVPSTGKSVKSGYKSKSVSKSSFKRGKSAKASKAASGSKASKASKAKGRTRTTAKSSSQKRRR